MLFYIEMASLLDISLTKKKKSTTSTYYTPENGMISKIKKVLMENFRYDAVYAKRISESFISLPNIADRSSLFLAGAYALIEIQQRSNMPLYLEPYIATVEYADMYSSRIMGNDTVQFDIHSETNQYVEIKNFAESKLRFEYRNLIFKYSSISEDIKQAKYGTAEYLKKEMILIEMMQELYRYVLLLLMNNISAM